MRCLNIVAIPAGSTAGGFTSNPIPADQYTRMSAQGLLSLGSGMVGVLAIQCSNDKPPPGTSLSAFVPTNWTTITTVTITTPVASPPALAVGGNGMIQCVDICCEWVRLVWTLTTSVSAGQIKATAVMQGVQ